MRSRVVYQVGLSCAIQKWALIGVIVQMRAGVPRVAGVYSPTGQNVWTEEQEGKEAATVH